VRLTVPEPGNASNSCERTPGWDKLTRFCPRQGVPCAIVAVRSGRECNRNILRILRNFLKQCQSAESWIGALYLQAVLLVRSVTMRLSLRSGYEDLTRIIFIIRRSPIQYSLSSPCRDILPINQRRPALTVMPLPLMTGHASQESVRCGGRR
jgi:hypothetical protein